MPVAFVTGASGFIGSHLVPFLLDHGYEVRCLHRPPSDLKWLPLDRIKLYVIDPDSEAPFDFSHCLKDVDVVFHLAGLTKARNKAEYFGTNVGLTKQVLDAVRAYSPKLKRFVMMSSHAAAGPTPPGKVKDETADLAPLTYYGDSKLAAEQLFADYADIPYVIMRPCSVYGPRERDSLVLVKAVQRGFAPNIGSPSRRLMWVHVEDLIHALLLAAESPQAVGQKYFVTDGHVYTWRETQATLEKILGKKAFSIHIPIPLVYILAALSDGWSRLTRSFTIFNLNKCNEIVEQNWAITSEKIERELGFKPRLNLDLGMQDTIAWAKKNQWL